MSNSETPDVMTALISAAITLAAFIIIFGYPKIKRTIKALTNPRPRTEQA